MTEPVITVQGLTKQFGAFTAVDQVDMQIQRGAVHGFLGPNGSGKTTTIRLMCGLMKPSAGQVTVLGLSVPEASAEVRRHVGYMTQRFSLYEDMSIRENLLFLCRIHGLPRNRWKGRIAEVCSQFNLEELLNRRVGPMSGGQKRRIALAAAVLTEPELLILDEPTSEVDPNTRREMWEHFFELAQQGTTLLVSTHLMDEAERCHQLTIMNEGKVVADGSVQQLKDEMPRSVLKVDGDQVTPWVSRLSTVDEILAVSQVGNSLRILAASERAEGGIRAMLPEHMNIQLVPPTIEDVFVHATNNGKRGRA